MDRYRSESRERSRVGIWQYVRDRIRNVYRENGDDLSRSVAIVLTVLSTLAFVSFVMAGVVGAFEKMDAPAASVEDTAVPGKSL